MGGVAAGFVGDFIRGRKYGHEWYDWSFVVNRKAMAIGATIAALIVASTLGGRWQGTALSVIPATLVGATAAMTVDRIQRRRNRQN